METIGTRIALFRNARRWTQEHLAVEIGIPQSELSKIETDKVSPKWELITVIAEKLDVPAISLLPLSGNNVMYNHFTDQASNIMNQFSDNNSNEELWKALLKAKEELLETKDKLIRLLEQQRSANNSD